MTVKVKICGITTAEMAREICHIGADAIGLVFAESSRRVSVDQAIEIASAVEPFVATVGVFVGCDCEYINSVADAVGLDYVQLHGDVSAEQIAQVDRPVLLSLAVKDNSWLAEARGLLADPLVAGKVKALLVDTYKKGMSGGTGESFNWELIADARELGAMEGLPPLILAGGLDCDNVQTGISVVRPWAVDVSSGVESAPGIKDKAQAGRFIQLVRSANEASGGWF